jgi:DNA invertase Pin-like site-specific DNA recombinase
MISIEYELHNFYKFVAYLRMSDTKQNPRSPDQQYATIHEVMQRCGCPWKELKVYRDDGKKGRYISRRPGFQQMLREIELGQVQPDLIVVDTFERFGRADEIETIRRELRTKYGVLIVSAYNNFADPTGVVGKAVGMIEQMRATEDGRVKAHNVVRGKKDTLRLKRWPGGPVPFGYQFKNLIDNSREEPKLYRLLEPNPATAWIVKRIFQKAFETGWGDLRVAKFCNADPEIPSEYKPFNWSTIGYWLSSEIYIGVGVWGVNCTDIIDDARVIEPNRHPEEIVRVENFCEPLISAEVFRAVQEFRKIRAARFAASRRAPTAGNEKLIKPIAGGISLIYPLAGLVKCSELGGCGGCMVPRPSGRKSKTGTTYIYYVCPRSITGACPNKRYLHEGRLWAAIVSCLRKKLFAFSEAPNTVPSWFAPLVEQVRQVLEKRRHDRPRRTQDLHAQIKQIDQKMSGWRDSLGNRDLSPLLRQDLERDYEKAAQEKARLEADLTTEQAIERQLETTLDPLKVLDSLKRLDQVLAGTNITELNIELAKHIECIECRPDGSVILRGTYLGLFEGAVEMLSQADRADLAGQEGAIPPSGEGGDGYEKVMPRRLTRRKLNTLSADDGPAPADVERALDPQRFAGLAGAFVWEEPLVVPRKVPWVEEYADQVLEYITKHPEVTQDKVAEHFGKTRPTIRAALRIAHRAKKPTDPQPVTDAKQIRPQVRPDPSQSPLPSPQDDAGNGKTA